MDLSKDLPDFLQQPRFDKEQWTLTEFRSNAAEGTLYQKWNSQNFDLFVQYNHNTVPEKCHHFINLQKEYTDQDTLDFISFVPPVIEALNKAGGAFQQEALMEELVSQSRTATYKNDSNIYAFYYDNNYQLEYYEHNPYTNEANGEMPLFFDTHVYNAAGVKTFFKRTHTALQTEELTAYYENGQKRQTYSKTAQGIIIGKVVSYDEAGTITSETDADKTPFTYFCYNNAIDALAANGFNTQKCELKLFWKVFDDDYNHAYDIDAVTGELLPVAAPVAENTETCIIPPQKTFERYLYDLIGEKNTWGDDSELIYGPADYMYCIKELSALSKDTYPFEQYNVIKKEDCFETSLTIQQTTHVFPVAFSSDYFHTDMIRGINTLLRQLGSQHTFYLFHDGHWGQEMAFCFIHDTLADCILAKINSVKDAYYWGDLNNYLDMPAAG